MAFVVAFFVSLSLPIASLYISVAIMLESLKIKAMPITSLSPTFDLLSPGALVADKCILFAKYKQDGAAGKPTKGDKSAKAAKPAKGVAAAGGDAEPPAVVDLQDDRVIGAIDIRVGFMSNARKHPNSEKLFVEDVDIGAENPRQICSGVIRCLRSTLSFHHRDCIVQNCMSNMLFNRCNIIAAFQHCVID